MHAALIATWLAFALRSALAQDTCTNECTDVLSAVDSDPQHECYVETPACQAIGIDYCCLTIVGGDSTCNGPAPIWTAQTAVDLENVVGQQAAKDGFFEGSKVGVFQASFITGLPSKVENQDVLSSWFHAISRFNATAIEHPEVGQMPSAFYFTSPGGNIRVQPFC